MKPPCAWCTRAAKHGELCPAHYKRLRRHGDPLGGGPPRLHGSLTNRLDAFTERGDGCWRWTGTRNNKGYGQVSTRENGKLKMKLAHRLAWEQVNGPVPSGLLVLHSCDNPGCVRPDHLSVGTQSDNRQQMWDRGRR